MSDEPTLIQAMHDRDQAMLRAALRKLNDLSTLGRDMSEIVQEELANIQIERVRKRARERAQALRLGLERAEAEGWAEGLCAPLESAAPDRKARVRTGPVQQPDLAAAAPDARARDAESASALLPPRDEAAGPTAPQQGGRVDSPKPVQRQAAQEQAILAAIQQLGAAPLKLIRPPSGKSGIKARVCRALHGEPLFVGTTVFTRAWERLMKRGAIAYAD